MNTNSESIVKGVVHMSEHDLEEKFTVDDGGSTVPSSSVEDPVTGAGGAIKKKKADVKKTVDATADKIDTKTPGMNEDSEAAEVEIVEEEVIEIDESISKMFEGMDLSEEFKNKVTLVFEAAVNEAATTKANAMAEEYAAKVDQEMQESVDSTVNTIIENLDSYLDYVVEEWMKENELAIEAGIKVEMAESLMNGLKELFEEHNIEVDDETVDVVAGLEEEVEEMKAEANKTIDENVKLAKEIAALKAEKVFAEMTEDLTMTQRERLKVLSEKLDFENVEEYTQNLETLKESFFAEAKPIVEEAQEEEEEILTEETVVAKPASEDPSINALVAAFAKK
jgi:hypothetical protein